MSQSFRTRQKTRDQARRLRGDLTDAEKKLWTKLRDKQIAGHYFRRQVPIGPYVADFCCLKAKLIVEVDGGQHADSQRDRERSAWLAHRGYRVLRFWNNEVMGNIEGVVSVVTAALAAPAPTPEANADLHRRPPP